MKDISTCGQLLVEQNTAIYFYVNLAFSSKEIIELKFNRLMIISVLSVVLIGLFILFLENKKCIRRKLFSVHNHKNLRRNSLDPTMEKTSAPPHLSEKKNKLF